MYCETYLYRFGFVEGDFTGCMDDGSGVAGATLARFVFTARKYRAAVRHEQRVVAPDCCRRHRKFLQRFDVAGRAGVRVPAPQLAPVVPP